MTHTSSSRTLSLTIALVLVSSAIIPGLAAAAPDLTASGVGSFLIAADGTARGSNVLAQITESAGLLTDFAVSGIGGGSAQATVFNSVSVQGFEATRKIEGSGSESISLVGNNAIITAVDSANSLLIVHATADATVEYALASDVVAHVPAESSASAHHVIELTLESGATLGHLILVPATSGASSASGFLIDASAEASTEVVADLHAGEAVLFRGAPGYYSAQPYEPGPSASLDADAAAYLRVVADLAATGRLAGDFVSEFDTSAIQSAALGYVAGVQGETALAASNALRTTFVASGAAQGAVVFNYDIDYEILAIQHAEEAAVYINGALAKSVSSAEALKASAEADQDAYYAFTLNGRTQVLASVSSAAQKSASAGADASSVVSIVNVARFDGRAPAAETQAVTGLTTNVVGRFEAIGDLTSFGAPAAGGSAGADAQAKFVGRFSSGVISKEIGGARIVDYSHLETRTEVFESVHIVGEVLAEGRASGDAIVNVAGPTTAIQVQDDIYGTAIVSVGDLPNPSVKKQVDLDLSKDVRASLVSPQVVRLDGPNAYLGWLVIAGADGSFAKDSRFDLNSNAVAQVAAEVSAQLSSHTNLVFVSQSKATGYASGETIARGIAAGTVGAQALVGVSGQAVTHINADYFEPVHLQTISAERGALDFNYKASAAASAATSFLVDTRGTALMAKGPEDIDVYVDGAEAELVSSASAVLNAQVPSYHVDTSAVGSLMVIVNAASQARAIHGADVSIVSSLAARAQANAASDLFGVFSVLPDGSAIGSYVQAHTNVAAGVVSGFTVTAPQGPTVVFDEIRPGVGAFAGAGASGTSKLTLAKRDVVLTMTDQTSAIMNIAAEAEATVEFVLSTDVEAQQVSRDVVLLEGPNGFLGALVVADVEGRGHGAGSLSLPAVVVPEVSAPQASAPEVHTEVIAELSAGAQVVFKEFAGIETELNSVQRAQLANAIAAGQIAGQVVVQSAVSGTAQLAEIQNFAGAAGEAALQATTSFASTMSVVTAATSKEVTVTLSSALETGKTVVISLDEATLPSLPSGNAEILFDGQVAAQASSYADVLDATDDGGVAEYFILTSSVSGASQVLVSVPHFSVHTVTLREKAAEPTNVFLWVSLGLALVVLTETVVLVRRRHGL